MVSNNQPPPQEPCPSNSRVPPEYFANIAVSETVDWISLVGPAATFETTRKTLLHYFPEFVPKDAARRLYPGPGLVDPDCRWTHLASGHLQKDSWILSISGQNCAHLGNTGLLGLVHDLDHTDLRATRFDVAVDLKGDHPDLTTLIFELEQDCNAQAVHPHRKHRPVREYDGSTLTGETLYHGSPSSDRLVRVYDKGLESTEGKSESGKWIRWETQFNKNTAQAAFTEFLGSPCSETLRSLAAGIFERINGPSARMWNYISDAPLTVTSQKPESTLDGYLSWLRSSVLPKLLAVSEASGQSVQAFLESKDLLRDLSPSEHILRSAVVREARERYSS